MEDQPKAPGRRGRAAKKQRNDDEDEESAYSDDEGSEYDESDESISSVESEEYESGESEAYDDDEEDYGRRGGRGRPSSTHRPVVTPSGFYSQWVNPGQQYPSLRPMMPMQPGVNYTPGAPIRPPPPPALPVLNPNILNAAVHKLLSDSQGGKAVITQETIVDLARKAVMAMISPPPPPAQTAPQTDTSHPERDEKVSEQSKSEEAQKTAVLEESEAVSPKSEEMKESVAAKETDKAEETLAPDAGKQKVEEPKADESQHRMSADELKQRLATQISIEMKTAMSNPNTRAIILQRLYQAQIAKMQASGQLMMPRPPMPMYRPMTPYPPPGAPSQRKPKEKRTRAPMTYEGDDADTPIAARRGARSAARKVDFSRLYQEEQELEEEIEKFADQQEKEERDEFEGSAITGHDMADIKPVAKKRGRKPKSRQASDEEGEGEFVQEEEEMDVDGMGEGVRSAESDEEPGVSKILSYRKTKSGKEEFLVKFHNLSYLHVEWISYEEMASQKMGASRIKKFLSKPLSMHHYDDKNPFNPDYFQIDRVIYGWEHPTIEDETKSTWSYLVKWKSLPYEEATWEKKESLVGIADFEDKVNEWLARPALASRRDPMQLRIGQRPDKTAWKPMPQSPVYKDENALRSYQLEGVNWLVYCWINKQSCIIADEMGLGKTVQSVAFIRLLQQQFKVPGPFIVVAPLSTIPHWEREFQAWTNLNVIVYHGTVKSRDLMHEYEFYYKDEQDRVIPHAYKFDVLITTYEMAQAGFDALQPIVWRAGIFDEAHRLKNRNSKAAEVLSLFRLEHKILLTGTPLQNNLGELYALLHFLQPQRFADEDQFLEQYGNLQRSEDVQRLQELLRPLMLRRLKEDVEKSIPVKEETVIEVELTALQKRYYRAILEKNFAFLTKGARGNNTPNLVNTMMELRKCCIHPYLIKGTEDRILKECGASSQDEIMGCMIQASGKLVLVDKLLRRLREQGSKVLIFSQMTRCLDLLGDFLAYREYPCERIDGAVKGEDRQAAIDRFCDPKSDSFVFLLCTRAGGVGINLTVADTVILYDSDWNPQNVKKILFVFVYSILLQDLQAQARCHRIGQEKSVKVYRLITRNTYEREMFDKAGLKLGLDRAVLQRMNIVEGEESGLIGTHAPQLSKKEVEILLKKGAYGVLMDNDEDSQRFCDEDIDQILSRRTQVIRHGGDQDANAPRETSLFSKATFAATADDYDIDLDDPNFWEMWAKRLNMNPREMLSGSGQSIDEPRIRRQAKRLKDVDILKIELPPVKDNMMAIDPKPGKTLIWSDEERNTLLNLLLKYGPNRLEKIVATFEGRRSKNDLIACIKSLIRFCLEHVMENMSTDRYFKEDHEKLLLANLDFDLDDRPAVVDDSTGRVDLLAADQQENREGDQIEETNDNRANRPYPNATRQQTAEFTSFLKNAPEHWLEGFRSIAYPAALRMQLVDFLRDVVERSGDLPVPPLPGSTPAEGWNRKDDQALLMSIYNNGYGSWELQGEDGERKRAEADEEVVASRLVKLVMAIVKRTQAAAKLAMHQVVKTRRRKTNRSDDEGDDDDEDDEEFVDEEKPRRGGRRVTKDVKEPTELTVFWSRRDQQEFVKVVRGYGLPKRDEDGDRDWTVFSQLGDYSASILRKSDTAFDEFAELFIDACEKAASTRRRRRTKKEMEEGAAQDEGVPGELFAADEDGAMIDDAVEDEAEEDVDSDEDFKGPTKSQTAIPALSLSRARALLDTINFMDQVRDETLLESDLESALSKSRRTTVLPRWWKAGVHDAALIRAAAKYGTERLDLFIADKTLPFYQVYADLDKVKPVSADGKKDDLPATYASGRKRRSTRAEMSAKFRPDTLPKLVDEKVDHSDWSPSCVLPRLRKSYEMATSSSPAKPDSKAAGAKTDSVEHPTDDVVPASLAKRKRVPSPKKRQSTLLETRGVTRKTRKQREEEFDNDEEQ